MTYKTQLKNTHSKIVLVKSPTIFKAELEERIKEGEKLSLNSLNPRYYSNSVHLSRKIPIREEDLTDKERQSLKDFYSWSGYNSELLKRSFSNSDNEYQRGYNGCCLRIYTNDGIDLIKNAKEKLSYEIDYLQRLIKKLPLFAYSDVGIAEEVAANFSTNALQKDLKKIFIVHGHDSELRTEVELFINQLGYEPIVLFKQPNKGCTIIEKLEREVQDVAYVIVLYTACDLGKAKDAVELLPRARQNVVFEHGYMCARLGRDRVCALLESGVEMPGDLNGIVYISCDKGDAWKISVIKEMKSVGMVVDANRLM